ncbi:MAG TPA: urea ABC transporter permease subunit UrtC [Verrucomicrobiae bacterium]|jgi:urea transport system permease protein|nr:urea ABC transporter permease subunit UrtC [Verrucomicrobiae bacterium]
MNILYNRILGGKTGARGLLVMAIVLLIGIPCALNPFWVNLVGKYLCFAFTALGLALLWGRAGILSLGQGLFFGLGGYCMAMFLKLEASDPISTKIQSTPGIPDFMDWNQLKHLPALWVPFKSLPFSLFAVVALPTLVAFIVGLAMFKRRVGGVYFAIITQALALIFSLGIDGNQGYTGGRNGITDLKTMWGWDIRTRHAQYILYFATCLLLLLSVALLQWLLSGKMGKMLSAMREREDRLRFSGYDVSMFKIFVFCVAAVLSGIGGALFVLQVGFIAPSLVGIVPSIEMVIFVAIGGRASFFGVIYGALLVNAGKSLLSDAFPQAWLFCMGGLFIGVVMLFPNGLAGGWDWWCKKAWPYLMPAAKDRSVKQPAAEFAEVSTKGQNP